MPLRHPFRHLGVSQGSSSFSYMVKDRMLGAAASLLPAAFSAQAVSVKWPACYCAAEGESRNLSRANSLPDRPRSSASNGSTGSDTQSNTPTHGGSMTRRAGMIFFCHYLHIQPSFQPALKLMMISLLAFTQSICLLNPVGPSSRARLLHLLQCLQALQRRKFDAQLQD